MSNHIMSINNIISRKCDKCVHIDFGSEMDVYRFIRTIEMKRIHPKRLLQLTDTSILQFNHKKLSTEYSQP